MLSIAIASFICICLLVEQINDGEPFGNLVLYALFYIFVSASCIFILSFTCSYIVTEEYTYSFNIESIEDNSNINGNFGLGYGRMHEDMCYYFIRHYPEGDNVGHIPANTSYIKYDNSVHPNIKVWKDRTNKKLKYFIPVIPLEFIANKYVITVPIGTTKYHYNIDLEE